MNSDSGIECYYRVLGVDTTSPLSQIRKAYHKLAMEWHPDKWTRNPCLLGQAKQRFQQIQEAYSVLSDNKKRRLYDAGLYDPNEEEEDKNDLGDFLEELLSTMANVKREEKEYSMEELQQSFIEMVRGFGYCNWDDDFGSSSQFASQESRGRSKRGRWEPDSVIMDSNSHFHLSGLCN